MTLSERFAEYICDTRISPDNTALVQAIESRILDYIAVTCAAPYYSDIASIITRYAETLHNSSTSMPPSIQAFTNAAFAHILDYDDGHLWAGIHAAGPVIGSVFALAPRFNPSGREVMEAIMIGYEIEYRLGIAMGKSHIDRGFHGSCTCGVFGAAAAAAKIMRLSKEQTTYALGIAGLAAFGSRQPLAEGQMAKPVQVGFVAERGVNAAFLAAVGMQGPREIFEGHNGILSILTAIPQQTVKDVCLDGLGKTEKVRDTYTKLYPCARYTHPAIEGTAALRSKISDVAAIKRITVNTFDIAINATVTNQKPKTPAEARFSMNYTLATALLQGFVGLDDFKPESIANPERAALGAKVEAYSTDAWNNVYPEIRGAEIIIETADGIAFSHIQDTMSGMDGDPEVVRQKLMDSCKKVFPKEHLENIAQAVAALVKQPDLSEVVDLCSRAGNGQPKR